MANTAPHPAAPALAASLGILALLVCLLPVGCSNVSPAAGPLSHEMYVWQRVWKPELGQAVRDYDSTSAGWRVLVAQTNTSAAWLEFLPDVHVLRETGKPLTAVVRIDGERDLDDAAELIGRIAAWYRAHAVDGWTSVEVDYDCPTRRLREYARFIDELQAALPAAVTVSITALPTWLESPDLATLLAAVDHSVLQVHSVLDPRQGLFSAPLAKQWLSRYAARTSKPFKIALPNYGSKVSWDEDGSLVAVSSEGEDFTHAVVGREVEADALAVQQLLADLTRERPQQLRGVVWFRLPVQGDRRIWSATMFRAVLAGRPLERKLVVTLDQDSLGAYRVSLRNEGTEDIALPDTIRLEQQCRAVDGQGGYVVERGADHIKLRRGVATKLRAGDAVVVGWTRCAIRAEGVSVES